MPDFTPLGPDQVPLDTLAQRVWFAWHCLPRQKDGFPPSWRGLEMANQLPNGVFSKILSGSRQTVEAATFQKLARALAVPVLWLLSGDDPPAIATTGRFEVLGAEQQDPRELDKRVRTYLRRCGFDDGRIEQAISLLLAAAPAAPTPREEAPPPISLVTRQTGPAIANAMRAEDDDGPSLTSAEAAWTTLEALSAGEGDKAHRAARVLARKVLSSGPPLDAVAILTAEPTWSAAALRLADAEIEEVLRTQRAEKRRR